MCHISLLKTRHVKRISHVGSSQPSHLPTSLHILTVLNNGHCQEKSFQIPKENKNSFMYFNVLYIEEKKAGEVEWLFTRLIYLLLKEL